MTDLRDTLQTALQGYALERELGRGGMATVFLAQDLKHKRPVALKVLHPDLAHALGPERFHREVELAARLQHPHILTVLDSGDADGHLWFTMPFVDGESLRDRLTRDKQLQVADAVRIAGEAGRALDYAHRQGVIHRDIKPENILLTTDGDTLVADFGIARALSGGEDRLTETGLAVGTPAYMSPEQAAGERNLDVRTDIYALGAVLYEMLVGEPPFTGATPQAVIAKRFRGDVPRVRDSRPAVPEAVDQAVATALATIPADRFASAAELVKALGVGQAATPSAGTAVTPAATLSGASQSAPAAGRRRVPTGFALMLLGFLIGAGVLFAWRKNSHGTAGGASIVVLPFENQGDTSQAYFADGITDEIRGKLTALPGLQVIAGSSSRSFKGSGKSVAEIARELGVRYVLTAQVRWATSPDGTRRVQVNPELVDVSSGTPTSKWQQSFNAALTDVFQVQAEIAGRVAGALNLALSDSVSRRLAARPTNNLPAYDAFLRGEEITATRGDNSPAGLRTAIAAYKQALALDSTFVPAWARLSRAQCVLYSNSVPDPALGAACLASAERALALDPNSAHARIALGTYYLIVRADFRRARAEMQAALRIDPTETTALRNLAQLDQIAGEMDSSLVHGRQAVQLDPRNSTSAAMFGTLLRWSRRYAEAREALDRSMALAPSSLNNLQERVMVELSAGDLDSAQSFLRRAAPRLDQPSLVAYFATYYDLYWVLDDAQQRLLLTLSPAEFDNDLLNYGIVQAQTAWLRGDRARVRSAADTALIGYRARMAQAPDDAQSMVFGGLANAYLGQKAEAVRLGERGVAAVPYETDARNAPYFRQLLARIYVLTGEPDKAIGLLETILQHPADYSAGWLRIDPSFASLKGNPRFERLIAQR